MLLKISWVSFTFKTVFKMFVLCLVCFIVFLLSVAGTTAYFTDSEQIHGEIHFSENFNEKASSFGEN